MGEPSTYRYMIAPLLALNTAADPLLAMNQRESDISLGLLGSQQSHRGWQSVLTPGICRLYPVCLCDISLSFTAKFLVCFWFDISSIVWHCDGFLETFTSASEISSIKKRTYGKTMSPPPPLWKGVSTYKLVCNFYQHTQLQDSSRKAVNKDSLNLIGC